MKCPHCNVAINFEEADSAIYEYDIGGEPRSTDANAYELVHGFCPDCDDLIVLIRDGKLVKTEYGNTLDPVISEEIIYPKSATRPVEKEVPEEFAKDYHEAAAVLGLSPKASAAISRRLLQQLIREKLGVSKPSLAKEIEEVIENCGLPTYLNEAIDAIRSVGNFAAHPIKDTNTGEIAEVESGEAEWLLEVLDSLFDFVFVQPARLEKRKRRLNSKLKASGKPPMKDA